MQIILTLSTYENEENAIDIGVKSQSFKETKYMTKASTIIECTQNRGNMRDIFILY